MAKELNLSDLKRLLKTEMANIQNDVGRLTIETAKVILREAVLKTPVDTSTALSNWQISNGSLNGNQIAPYFMGEKGSTFAASANFAIQIGYNALDSHKVGSPVFIYNCVDYITDLETGSSPQRPEGGFVKQAVMQGTLYLSQRVKSWQKKRL